MVSVGLITQDFVLNITNSYLFLLLSFILFAETQEVPDSANVGV